MKTIFYRVILSIICGFTLTITSCSDDDDKATLLSAPEGIKYSEISSNSFTVTWSATPDATSYIVKIKDESGELTEKSQTVSAASATFAGLDSEKKYWVAVCSVTGTGSSPFSQWVAIKVAEGAIARNFASGAGIEAYPFVIKTPGQLKLMAYLVNKTNDIKNNAPSTFVQDDIEMDPDFDYTTAYYELGGDIDMSGVNDWVPIGTGSGNASIAIPDKNMFGGHFDGKDHTISNLTVNYSSSDPTAMCGLFGLSDRGCTISNLNVSGNITALQTGATGDIANYLVAGGILAYNYGATITNCTFTGGIQASFKTDVTGTTIAGGICGSLLGVVNECTVKVPASSQISGSGETPQVGAIVGYGTQGSLVNSKAIIDGAIFAETKPIDESSEYGEALATAGGICATVSGVSIGACEVIINGSVHAISKKTTADGAIRTAALAGGIAGAYAADMFGNCKITINGSVKAEADNSANAGGAIASQVRAGYGCAALHATITGEVIATCSSKGSGSDASYAGGLYGMGSFQMGGMQDSDVILKGTIRAEHPQIAMAGGVAGSMMAITRCWTIIEKDATISAEGGTSGASCGGLIGNLLSGGIYGCYTICKGTVQASSATAGKNPINIGGIAGAAQGSRIGRKYVVGSYSLIEGTLSGTGTLIFSGAIAGSAGAYTTMNETYWWSASDDITGHTGAGASDQFKLPDSGRSSLEEAAESMNGALYGNNYGYFFYREKDGFLNITTYI